MEINRGNLDALFTTYSTAFTEGAQTGATPTGPNAVNVSKFAMSANVSGAAVVHAWLTALPQLTKWVGTRLVNQILSRKLTVENIDYATAVSVKKTDIETDQYGLYTPIIRNLGNTAGRLWEKLLIDALVANGNWADGSAFFLTNRKYGANTINNKTTSALDATTFAAAVTAMRSYVAENGEPLEVQPRVLLVGPKLEKTAFDLVKNTLVSAGSGNGGAVQNWAQGIAEVQVSGRLVGTYDDYWFLLGDAGGIMPGFIQKRKEPLITRQDDLASDAVFLNNEFRYGVEASGAAFLTLPHLAYGGIVS